jgi:predicted FMN-binding regulatory protein PaiB
MLKGIKAFRLDVTRMQFKEKLSQNKKSFERSSIIEGLGESEDSSEKTIADYMRSMEK